MKKAIIIGAGPAGLTAAYEFLAHTDIQPVVLEATKDTGGLSQTVNYKGNRIDIGGHRFFSKSARVMEWWFRILPPEKTGGEVKLRYQNKETVIIPLAPETPEAGKKMLIRDRLSRILFAGKLYSYPLRLNPETLGKLGLFRIARIGFSYTRARLFPVKNEKNLEDFFINRFGKELYSTFFKDYTEKVWGQPCTMISPDWGRQRIRGLSLTRVLQNALRFKIKSKSGVDQSQTETSLIEKFLYPQYGPGQLWESVVEKINEQGGQVAFDHRVIKVNHAGNRIISVTTRETNGEEYVFSGDHFISSMPVSELIRAMGTGVPETVQRVAEGLVYRDFIVVGVLVKELKLKNRDGSPVRDNWIYIQENNVKLGRLQIYNNWSPFMVADPGTTWLGLEYFCNEGDELWNMTDPEMVSFAIKEIERINIIHEKDFLDAVVVRMPKAYPTYTGTYNEFETIRSYIDRFENLFLTGRNGMHKYNNQDHSMLTAMLAVEHIRNGITDKTKIWEVNSEDIYHEE